MHMRTGARRHMSLKDTIMRYLRVQGNTAISKSMMTMTEFIIGTERTSATLMKIQ